jgi:hypothetical protein
MKMVGGPASPSSWQPPTMQSARAAAAARRAAGMARMTGATPPLPRDVRLPALLRLIMSSPSRIDDHAW